MLLYTIKTTQIGIFIVFATASSSRCWQSPCCRYFICECSFTAGHLASSQSMLLSDISFHDQAQNQCIGLSGIRIATMRATFFQLSLFSILSFLVLEQNPLTPFSHKQTNKQPPNLQSISSHKCVPNMVTRSTALPIVRSRQKTIDIKSFTMHLHIDKYNFPKLGKKCISNTIHTKYFQINM